MKRTRLSVAVGAALAAASLGTLDAKAVRLDPEAGGQVLIYPYYTVRSYGTDPFNTYISIVNTSADAKALRVYFREGKAGLTALGLNVFLSPNDTWTAALVPSADGGTQLITADASCVSPALPQVRSGVRGTSFSNSQFPTDTLDRTREGYAEVIEMATLTGPTAAAITQDASGVPHSCAAVLGSTFVPPAADMAPPSGGLQGTLTLINVASGMDFTVNAEALADFGPAPAYTTPATVHPNLSDANPVSVITTPTRVYRLQWPTGIDAVSSVLMSAAVINEYVLDTPTSSSSDWILTFPTRSSYLGPYAADAPFTGTSGCEPLSVKYFNRESSGVPGYYSGGLPPPPGPTPTTCSAASVWSVMNGSNSSSRRLFGSANNAAIGMISTSFYDGWAAVVFTGTNATQAGLVSLPSSSRIDLSTGNVTAGSMRVLGLPVTGFFARSFVNGLLSCSAGTCQGSYGSAFDHHYDPLLVPAP